MRSATGSAYSSNQPRREVSPGPREAGECVGIGVTSFVEIGNPGSFEQAKVMPDDEGKIWIHVGVASVGQGVQTVLAHVAADIMDIDRDRIQVTHHDTDVIPEGQGAFSSRGTVFGGRAVAGAVADFLDNARQAAAERLDVDPDRIVIEKGEVAFSAAVDASAPPPLPPGHRRSVAARRDAFTLASFDRLRVLTTELKRLIAAGAPVALRLGSGPALDESRLASALWWV